jgi:hypothetical protein
MSLTICYIQLMAIDLNWLVGRRLSGLIRREYDWSFSFDDSTSISVESVWRLQGRQGVVVTSTDDGQLIGLKVPVSASDRPLQSLKQSAIATVELREPTNDLLLHFADGLALEFLCLSSGYESWHLTNADFEIIRTGGGKHSILGSTSK